VAASVAPSLPGSFCWNFRARSAYEIPVTFIETIAQSLGNLRANRLRSFLTMFGIAWGIFSIMLLVAAGEGLKQGYENAQRTLGKDILLLFPGRTSLQAGGTRAGHTVFLQSGDVAAIREQCPEVKLITPELSLSQNVSSRFNSGHFRLSSGYPFYADIRSLTLASGRYYNAADEAGGRRVLVLGALVADQLFHGQSPLGETVQLGGFPYTVVGVLVKKDQNSNYNGPDNRKMFAPFASVQRDFPKAPPAPPDAVDNLIVVPRHVALHAEADLEVRRVLGRLHHFDPEDREALFDWDTIKEARLFETMTNAMQTFLGITGLMTLLLGGIGVTNIMLVSAAERTREIGIRKAVGATRRAVMLQFLAEAAVLTLLAGSAGMAIGLGLCWLVNRLPMPAFFAGLIVTPAVGVMAAAVLGVVAILAGWYPAHRAANVDPIQALQYEH